MTRGTTLTVARGQMCDAAFPPAGWWDDFPACGRYASTPTNNAKNIRQAEIDLAADLDHGFLWFAEQSETTPINSTLDDDRRLADQSAQMATDLGLAPGAPHWFAVDTDGRSYMDQIRAAFVTYRDEVPSQWPIGAYAGSDVIDQLVADGVVEYGHIPAALSWSSTSRPVDNSEVFLTRGVRWYRTPNAHLFQHPSESYKGGRIDRNDVLRPTPVWFPGRVHIDPVEEDLTLDESRLLAEIHAAIFEPQPSAPDSLSMQWAAYNAYSNTAVIREWLTADGGLSHYVREAVITVLRSPEAQLFFVRHTPEDLEEIANAVVRALPPAAGSGTLDEFIDAVQLVLTKTKTP